MFNPDEIVLQIEQLLEPLSDDEVADVYLRLPAVESPFRQIFEQDLLRAAGQLARCDKGRCAMVGLLALLDDGGLSLDQHNKAALKTLLDGAWGRYAMTARDAMREALGQ